MKKVMIAAVGACSALATPALAAEGFGRIESVPVAFNGTAKAYHAPLRMVVTKCSAIERNSCTYGLSGEIAAIATLQKGTRIADTVTIIYGANSDAKLFIVAIGVAMATWSPAADIEERNLALNTLTTAIKERTTREVTLGDMCYVMATKPDAGFVLLQISKP